MIAAMLLALAAPVELHHVQAPQRDPARGFSVEAKPAPKSGCIPKDVYCRQVWEHKQRAAVPAAPMHPAVVPKWCAKKADCGREFTVEFLK